MMLVQFLQRLQRILGKTNGTMTIQSATHNLIPKVGTKLSFLISVIYWGIIQQNVLTLHYVEVKQSLILAPIM